jgi:uncharacterized delta-60 repeat protein
MRTSFIGVAASSGGFPGAPGATRNVVATAFSEEADVAWDAPISNGGSAITDYELQFSLNGTSLWSTAVSTAATAGALDTEFDTNTGTGFDGNVEVIAIQSDGKIICGGGFTTFNGTTANDIVRLNPNGTLDTAFTTNIGTGFNDTVLKIAIQSDGKIICGGFFSASNGVTIYNIVRLNADGTRDTTFTTNTGTGFNASVNSIAIQSDGKIICGGGFTIFNPTTIDGKIFSNGTTVNHIARLKSGLESIYTFTGLTNGTSYIFRARAVNAIDAGPWVSTVIPVTPSVPVVTGGTLTSDATYYYRTFTSNGNLIVENRSISIDYFAIAGGGGGGAANWQQTSFKSYTGFPSGGGAAGTKSFSSETFSIGDYPIVIGAGGAGVESGGTSVGGTGSSSSIASVVSVAGGGRGGDAFGEGAPSNGGSNAEYSGALASGSNSGGGAGAGGSASGTTGGVAYSAFDVNYGAGGNGETTYFLSESFSPPAVAGPSGAANSGSGGGGSSGDASSGAGGSGRVVVRYLRSAVGG